jgi:hypothetical protein
LLLAQAADVLKLGNISLDGSNSAGIICSKKTFRLSQTKLASKSALLIIRLIVQNGTPSNIAFSLT